ncbi:leucine-rich repeat-containing protein 36 [Sphaerodactylus townsendi]|uniref:Uncharacterized protein n=1 Tax=Sphaerodactylus townsendi TaxID=933632 RepID=A0ACB8EB39_9SAUR|nr:leucine-rich repeat-containing protein 36 [Sphaerodactylus townsendi]
MALELVLSEAWVREQPALRGLQPEQVDSLSLQGTYAGKIISLGDSLKSFKNLQSLDLSRNLLASLEGLESLQSLEQLSLYYNHISSLLEVARLQTLPRLRELDLRLNPVTRKESEYRLFTVHRLQALEKLDDRTVRENERKAAHLHFSLKNKENLPHKEKSKEHTVRSPVLDQEMFAVSNLDKESVRTLIESDLSQSSHYHVPYHDGKASVRVSAPSIMQTSKQTKEHKPHRLQAQVDDAKGRHFQSPNPLDSEHKPLSSSPQARSSLCSPVRSRARSGKRACHVSFSEGEKETGRKFDMLDIGRDASPTRRQPLNDARKPNSHGVARDLRLDSYECSCLASCTARKEFLKRLADDRKAAADVHNYISKVAKEALAATRSSCGDFLGQYLEMDSDPESSSKHSSDAKLNSYFLPVSNPTSANFGNIHSKCRPLSDEIPPEDSQPASAPAPISVARKQQELPVSRSLSPLRVGCRQSRSPTRGFKEANKEHPRNEQKSSHIWTESPLGTEKSSPVIDVLRQLLELVDRYWSGSGSLLFNKDFLAPARDLLTYLMAAASTQQDVSSAALLTPSSNSQKPEESQAASFKELSGEASAALNYDPQGKHSFSYDELLSRNEQLSAHVEILTSELNQLKNQQDTISLLRESQKSLVSTNSFLLQQLNREQGPSSAKGALSEKTASSAKVPVYERTSHHIPSFSTFGSSQLCSSQQLSSCPL